MFTLPQECCQKFNLSLEIETIHLDFEERMHSCERNVSRRGNQVVSVPFTAGLVAEDTTFRSC